MSDRIAVMDGGMIAQIGSPQEVYESPASLFVADFIGSSNKLEGRCVSCSDGMAQVRLATGAMIRVPVTSGSDWLGQDLVVVVRPDHAAVSASLPQGSVVNELPGRVAKVAYLGTHREIELILADGSGASVRQSLATQPPQAMTKVGEAVAMVWPVARSIGFPMPANTS